MIVADPEVVEEKVTEHDAELWTAPGTSVHGLRTKEAPVSMPVWLKVTVPVGVIPVPGEASESTVAVQLLVWVVVIELGVQLTVAIVALLLTVTGVVPGVPAEWVESPLYVAVIVSVNGRVVPAGVYVTVHDVCALFWPTMRVHCGDVNDPEPLVVNETVPVGGVRGSGGTSTGILSSTTAVQSALAPGTSEVTCPWYEQETNV